MYAIIYTGMNDKGIRLELYNHRVNDGAYYKLKYIITLGRYRKNDNYLELVEIRKAYNLLAEIGEYIKTQCEILPLPNECNITRIDLTKDIYVFEQMYDLNLECYKELTMYILAGKKKLEEEENEVIPALRKKAELSGRQEDAQEVNDREALCNRFDKKIHDLELTRMVSLQMAPQIRMVQSSDVEMSEKIQSTLVNTIPLWKSQMIIALGVEHSRAAAEAQRKVSDLTNDLLKKNAEKLKVATVETAKESERGIVDMETLVATNESLMSTIDEVMHIQQEGRQKRREAESKLMQLEDELKNKMLNPRG